jgi:hypothetical protein
MTKLEKEISIEKRCIITHSQMVGNSMSDLPIHYLRMASRGKRALPVITT